MSVKLIYIYISRILSFVVQCVFCRFTWHFRNELTPEFNTMPAFNPKSTWKPPNCSRLLELF